MSVSLKPVASGAPSEAEMLSRAHALALTLAERAAACEELRRVPDETIADFVNAGFYRMLQPAAYGGYEMHPYAVFKVAMALAKGCPSSAWCLCLIAVHNWELALLDPRAAAAIWGKDDTTRISSSYAPFGKVERVDGGFRVSGRWPWSSGSDHCQWAMLGGRVPTGPGELPDIRSFLIPRSHYVIDDTWHVFGLKGTGSKDIVVEDAFVPEHMTHKFLDSFLLADEGRKTFTSPNYALPFGVVFAYCLASVTVGMADGALETFVDQMKVRTGAYDGAKATEDPFVRQRLAEAEAIVRGLHLRMDATFAALDAAIASGEPIPMRLRVEAKWDAAYIAKSAMQAVELLFKASGGRGIRLSNPLQRFFRDVHAASNHAFLSAEKGALNMGGVALGLDTVDFTL